MTQERIYRIAKIESVKVRTAADCGGFRPPKGHLDTQMFPECAGTPADRDIVKKTRENRKRHKKRASVVVTKQAWEEAGRKAGWMNHPITKTAVHADQITKLIQTDGSIISDYYRSLKDAQSSAVFGRIPDAERKKVSAAKDAAANAAHHLMRGLVAAKSSGYFGVDARVAYDIDQSVLQYSKNPPASSEAAIDLAREALLMLRQGEVGGKTPVSDIQKLPPKERAEITYSPWPKD